MGRWTPLILMAGGLAILLGTLLGISFPMGGQNSATAPAPAQRNRASKVLPANINVNSSGTSNAPANNNNNANRSSVAQVQQPNNNTPNQPAQAETDNTADENQVTDETQQSEPIRALW